MTTGFRQTLAERSRERIKKQKRLRRYFWAVYFFVILGAFGYIVIHPAWFIKEVRIEGAYSLSPHALSEKIIDHLSGRTFLFLPKQSFLFVSKRDIAENILTQYSRIFNVKVSISGFDTLLIVVDERRPQLLGCPLPTSSSSCFYIDQNGVLFEPAPRFSPGVFLTIVSPLVEERNVNHQVLESSEVELLPPFLSRLRKVLTDRLATEFLASDVTLLAHDDAEISLYHQSDQKSVWQLRFNRKSDFAKTLFYLDSALSTETFQADWLKAPKALEYVDARFGKKIFYRYLTYATSSSANN